MSNSPTLKKRREGQHPTADEKATAQEKFLKAYAKTANISLACRAAKIDRSTFYEWKKDDAFAARVALADEDANDVIEAEIFRRAVKGVTEPVINGQGLVYEYEPVLDANGEPVLNSKGKPTYKRGKQVTITKYSDTLIIFHAKKRIPGYRDKVDITTNGKDMPGLTILTDGPATVADPRYVQRGTRPVGEDVSANE